jgi:hypothetical protein
MVATGIQTAGGRETCAVVVGFSGWSAERRSRHGHREVRPA